MRKPLEPARMDVVIAILIALVTLTTALSVISIAAVWTGFILIS